MSAPPPARAVVLTEGVRSRATRVSSLVRLPTLLIWLTTLWVALWGDLTLGNVVSGLAVAIGVLAVARPTGVTGLERGYFRPIAALRFVLYFLYQLVKSNLIVAWEIATPGTRINRAIIGVDMHTVSPGVVTLVANAITLTPGTITVDVRERRDGDQLIGRTLYIHVLHFVDITSVRRDVLVLERLAIRAFGALEDRAACDDALAALDEIGAPR